MTQHNDHRCEQYCIRDVRKTQKKIKVLLQAVATLSVVRRGGKQILYFNDAISLLREHKLRFNAKASANLSLKASQKSS